MRYIKNNSIVHKPDSKNIKLSIIHNRLLCLFTEYKFWNVKGWV